MTGAELDRLALAFAGLASQAGAVVMAVYATDFAVRSKDDSSPVSDADEAAEALLVPGVEQLLPGVPIVAEEAVARGECPAVGETFVMIDPLDGTKEFVSRNGEFTVNVALVHGGVPVAGCVYAPARAALYVGGATAGWAAVPPGAEVGPLRPVRTRPYPAAGLVAVTSRSHRDAPTDAFLSGLPVTEVRDAGSSLKFCLVATGEADVYPRFGPTMEWDIAAGHAVLAAAGGSVLTPEGLPLRYGKPSFRNPPFVAWGGPVW
ncbi:MAG: 3'(2'),5'-bisphosphate nucleotidase CysQ [Actinomycetota bacterium]|nr:3'(2'),5'-bisphosphate nucleotidase CysQ [Actinomycetota bacterium]